MIRMLGVLCGAAIATALLTWLVGVPQFTTEREIVDPPLAVVARSEPAPLPEPEAEVEAAMASVASSPAPSVTAAEVEVSAAPAVADGGAEPPAMPVEHDPPPEPALPLPARDFPDPQWFAFWTPFRSEIAANGFVGRLQSVTGLDYRVVKVKPGVYEVAFAYTDDEEIDSNLSTISAATGLDLPGAR